LLVDCMSAAGSKSTAFGTLVSIIKNTELFASAPSPLILPAASLNLSIRIHNLVFESLLLLI
jgi:hypothetical protein